MSKPIYELATDITIAYLRAIGSTVQSTNPDNIPKELSPENIKSVYTAAYDTINENLKK